MQTVILQPMDENWARRSFPTYAFGEAFRGLFPMGGDTHAQFRIECIVQLSTGAMKALVLPAAFEQLRGASGAPFSIAPFREWTVLGDAPSPGRSVVVAGVPEHLTGQQVADELVEGTFPRQFGPGCPRFRLSASPSGCGTRGGAWTGIWRPREQERCVPGRAPEFAPSRCCCIFGDNELIEFLLAKGYLNLRWVLLLVCQYNPPTFYCAKCKRRGSHSTRFHRDLIHDHDG